MTHGERFGSGGTTAAALRPTTGHEPVPRSGAATAPAGERALPWDELFLRAPADQQQELLALARRQGLLYGHQLPAAHNGAGSAPEPTNLLLQELLAGRRERLEAFSVAEVDFYDRELDEDQRVAVRRALDTPDLCLIQGPPASGKSRLVAEVITQAALRGERVLVVSATKAATDHILELVGAREAVFAVRCLERDEPAERLPHGLRAFTMGERLKSVSVQPLAKARAELQRLQARSQSLKALERLFDELGQLAASIADLARRLDRLALEQVWTWSGQCKTVAPEGPFAASFRALESTCAAHRAELSQRERDLHEQQAAVNQERTALESTLALLAPLVDAKQRRQWWRAAWWKALFNGEVLAEHARLQQHLHKLNADHALLEDEAARLRQSRQECDRRYGEERQRLTDQEVARRRDELVSEAASLQNVNCSMLEQWQVAVQRMDEAPLRPLTSTPAAVDVARDAWTRAANQCAEHLDWTAQWIRCLEENSQSLAQRLPGWVNAVCGTLNAVRADDCLGSAANRPHGFDRLIVQEAERITRADFLHLAGWAHRWNLVAESTFAGTPGTHGSTLLAGSAPVPTGLFQGLWQTLHSEPPRLPYAWRRDRGRLVCRLRELTAAQQARLECEPLSDDPSIELRIHHTANADPQLAEIAFPERFGFAEAKQYVYRELDEMAIVAAGSRPVWEQQDARIVLQYAVGAPASTQAIVYEEGIREVFDSQGDGRTFCLEFPRSEQWDLKRAAEFARHRLGLSELGRTSRLGRLPRQASAGVTAVVADLLGDNSADGTPAADGVDDSCRRGCAAVVDFVAVPRDRDARAGHSHAAAPPARGGAGLEQDLAQRSPGDRLPVELRPLLPERGLVNYLEAGAVIGSLEMLAADPATLLGDRSGRNGTRPIVAVIALYAAQVALLRCLADRCAALRKAAFDLEIGLPEAFREREFGWVLVSLTRSHVHRAVTYGDGPGALALALTRARKKLILFGDPGTLARRRQWKGRLEQLTEMEAAGERAWVDRLVSYLQGAGRHARLFQFREGSTI